MRLPTRGDGADDRCRAEMRVRPDMRLRGRAGLHVQRMDVLLTYDDAGTGPGTDFGRPWTGSVVIHNQLPNSQALTGEPFRGRGAQQALIAKRIETAAALGCSILVSETLSFLEGSLGNLQKAGFRTMFEKEVYEAKSKP